MHDVIVYIKDKPLIICTQINDALSGRVAAGGLVSLSHPAPEKLKGILPLFDEESVHGFLIETADPGKTWKVIFGNTEAWEAAGGAIVNPAGEFLMMFRRGKWDLPKGKLDPGETIEACALREVGEETGLKNIRIRKKLTETFHLYPFQGKNILKQTHWFLMDFMGGELTVPQIEEDILDIQWVRREHLGRYLKYTYPNIRDVFEKAGYR